MEPERRVVGISSANDRDAEICDCKEAATDRVRVARAVIEVVALNEEKRQRCDIPNPPNL